MKKTVLTFGLISGGILAALMLGTLPFVDKIGFDKGEIVGYAGIVLSALLIFFGVRSYRENVGNGRISFGRGLAVGALITLISSVCYVATWELVYYKFMPDFGDKYASYMVAKAKAKGASPEKIEAAVQEARKFKVMYDRPLNNVALTFTEVLPLGLVVALASAGILRKTE
jgi:hypothetical protein